MSLTDEERIIVVQLQLEKADYNCAYNTIENDIVPIIEPTRLLIKKIEKYIYGEKD